jgi:hypothetical protein
VGSYPAAPGIASTTIAARPEVVGSYPAQGIGSLPAPPSITDAQQASWEQSNALARAAANPAYVSLSNLATGAPEASMAFANPQARWKAFNSVNPITESAPPVTVAVRPELPGSYPLASLNINRTPPSDIPPGGIQRVATPFGVDFGSVRTDLRDQIGTAANQVALSRGPVTQVAETPSYGPETPSYDYGGFDLPDPQAPTKQYVGVTYPGMETYSPPTYGGNNNQGSAPIQIIPTSGPATPTTPTVPTPPTTGTGSTTAPGNEWFKYYGTPQPYQTLVATPAPVIMNPAPISQGAGSLLPNIVVKPVFG